GKKKKKKKKVVNDNRNGQHGSLSTDASVANANGKNDNSSSGKKKITLEGLKQQWQSEPLKYGRDNGLYLLNNCVRILSDNFEPHFSDLLHCHVRSTGLMFENHIICPRLPLLQLQKMLTTTTTTTTTTTAAAAAVATTTAMMTTQKSPPVILKRRLTEKAIWKSRRNKIHSKVERRTTGASTKNRSSISWNINVKKLFIHTPLSLPVPTSSSTPTPLPLTSLPPLPSPPAPSPSPSCDTDCHQLAELTNVLARSQSEPVQAKSKQARPLLQFMDKIVEREHKATRHKSKHDSQLQCHEHSSSTRILGYEEEAEEERSAVAIGEDEQEEEEADNNNNNNNNNDDENEEEEEEEEAIVESTEPMTQIIRPNFIQHDGHSHCCDMVFKIADVGGHRNERKKWDYVLSQHNDVIVFVASAASFGQVYNTIHIYMQLCLTINYLHIFCFHIIIIKKKKKLLFEDSRTNGLRESLTVWEQVLLHTV
ncbi:hypothetical protein RFI_30954, partial [Reticulomyxa filosa]